MEFPGTPPGFLESFKESLLLVSRNRPEGFVDLSTDDPCLDGFVSFGQSPASASNKSCYPYEGDSVSCLLTDGSTAVNLTLRTLDSCRLAVPGLPQMSQERPLYLAIWVPIVAALMLGLSIGLVVFTIVRVRKNKKLLGVQQSTNVDYENLKRERIQSSSSTCTVISIISENIGPATPAPTCNTPTPSKGDSAISSLGSIPEEEGSIPDVSVESGQDSCPILKIIYTSSTANLPDFVRLSGFDQSNTESSTDATLRKKQIELVETSVQLVEKKTDGRPAEKEEPICENEGVK